jgi:macrodomain Ter protein organizer (MatP/YcbG family)
MTTFDKALAEAYDHLDELEDELIEFYVEAYSDGEDLEDLKDLFGFTDEDIQELEETLKKHVDSKGKITKKLDRKIRQRRATMTTGRSTSARKRSARKMVKTKRRNPGKARIAKRKRMRAIRRRKQMGLQ